MVPDFSGLGGLDVGDSSLCEVNVEAQEVEVIHCFKFDWVAEKVVVDEGLNGWVGEKLFVVHDEAIVNIPVVCEVESSVLEKVVVKLVPRMFNEGNGDVAEGRRELGANPSPSNLFVGVVACLENTGAECKGDNGCDVRGVQGTLCGMFGVMSTNMGVVEGVASGFGVDRESVCIGLALPLLDHRMDGVKESVLGDGIEETDKVVIGRVQRDVSWCVREIAVEVAPKLWD